jgi:ADP-L-glycero-D-manno-heptose 6-epimerase
MTTAPRTLVTGGAGFIGSNLVRALNDRGLDNVLIVDRLGTSGKWSNLVPLRYADYVEAEDFIARYEAEPESFGRIGTVFHLGACSATTETDATYLVHNNFEYSKRLARVALERGARFVYASSAATYGARERELRESIPAHELRPLNMYGYSKAMFDTYAARNGWFDSIVGLKFFNIFGPGEAHKGTMRSLVHKAFGEIRETGRVRLFKSYKPEFPDGGQKRDFLYVEDAVAMAIHLAENPTACGLYNIGSGEAHTWVELVTPIFETLGLPVAIEYVEMPDAIRDKYQYFTQAELERLRESGYRERITPLADAVAAYVRILADASGVPSLSPARLA